MGHHLLMGLAAGAVGTVALNIVTYLDMAVRARPASGMPAETVEVLTKKAGIDLAPNGKDQDVAENRKSGIGALLGYATGLGVGLVYGAVRPHLGDVPKAVAGVGLGLAAMAGSDVPATALGITDPTSWTSKDWASDIIPHLVYGLTAATAYDAFTNGR